MVESNIWENDIILNMSATQRNQSVLPLPVLPEGWTAEKDFKPLGTLAPATQRNIEPVGPHFLAHARRVSGLCTTVTCCLWLERGVNLDYRSATTARSLRMSAFRRKKT